MLQTHKNVSLGKCCATLVHEKDYYGIKKSLTVISEAQTDYTDHTSLAVFKVYQCETNNEVLTVTMLLSTQGKNRHDVLISVCNSVKTKAMLNITAHAVAAETKKQKAITQGKDLMKNTNAMQSFLRQN